ncbi:MAG TPA: MBL fold metallo-hydrolase [Bryobacteraceae bacterium]|nr:MBL fold metallo-hydrolase [Bryobacteraceae bacterium]
MDAQRREFLRQAAAFAAAAGFSRASFAQAAPAGPAAVKLTDKVTLITGAGNNIVALAGDGGSLLVDCGEAAHASDVLRMAGRVQTVFNTHWHLESTGANDAMAQAGAKLASSVDTELWMTQEIVHDWEKKTYPRRAKGALPTETFYTAGKSMFGGEPVEYRVLPFAHTSGDIYVYFPQSNVLAVGDAVQPGRLPMLDWRCNGWIGGMQDAHRTLLTVANDATKIVPGNGPVITRADLQANLEVITRIREHLVKLVKMGMGPKDMIEAHAMQDFAGLAGDPDVFLYTAYRGLWAHARELGGIV